MWHHGYFLCWCISDQIALLCVTDSVLSRFDFVPISFSIFLHLIRGSEFMFDWVMKEGIPTKTPVWIPISLGESSSIPTIQIKRLRRASWRRRCKQETWVWSWSLSAKNLEQSWTHGHHWFCSFCFSISNLRRKKNEEWEVKNGS